MLVSFRSLSVLALVLHWNVDVSGKKIFSRTPSGHNAIIAQMFQWTWDSIAAECTDFIGPAGYGLVQVSPAQEHVTGDQWWTDYQPVSYNITSKRGNRTQYQNMIETCHTAGVGVIADTLFNHMSAAVSGTGVAGTTFTKYDYPGIYEYQDFHQCGEPGNAILDWSNRTEVQTCELENLADLATDTEYVRARLAEFANDLLSLGVDGLRLDAALCIAATDIGNIISRLTDTPYITQEVTYSEGQAVSPDEYVGIGDVQEFRYRAAIKSAFLTDGISSLQDLDNKGWIASDVANVFVANHDTERDNSSLNDNSPSNTYTLALIFSLAHPYGTPTILSSYSGFTDTDAPAPNGGAGTCSGSGGANGWLCQHRWPAVAGMVSFRNKVNAASINALTNWVSPSSQQIAFSRGAAGFVAINNADTDWTAEFSSGLPAGTYCNVIEGAPSGGACAGASFTVAFDGTFKATVSARSAIALHVGALSS